VLEERFAQDLLASEEVTLRQWSRRPIWERVREQVFYFFRLWL
jgi:hypothetical protein